MNKDKLSIVFIEKKSLFNLSFDEGGGRLIPSSFLKNYIHNQN